MNISKNFDFLQKDFPIVAESATKAEMLINIDPRSSIFRIRHALETVVIRVFKLDKDLKTPEVQQLSHYVADEKFKEVIISKIPSARLGEADDIANAVLFLSSNQSSYINGETLHVNGGMYMAWQNRYLN